MPQSRGKYEFYQEASLSQKMAYKVLYNEKQIYPLLAGADPETSLKIGRLIVLRKHGYLKAIPEPIYNLIMDLLNMERMARFSTSEKVNEISKMGMQMPKEEGAFHGDTED